MRKLLALAILVAGFTSSTWAAVIPFQMKGGEVSVTVTYTGKGSVDATHEIWVFLFDGAPSRGARPLMTQTINKSGDTAIFKGVTQDPTYVAVAYDDGGGYDGTAAPPPVGTPIAYYSADGKTASPLKTAGGAKIKISFNDTRRMQ
jgi:hypothetical protein